MTTSLSASSLIDDFRDDIDKLRSLVKDDIPKSYDTDFNLYRWIKAWNGDVNLILPLFQEHMMLREVLKMDSPQEFGKFPPSSEIEGALTALRGAVGMVDLRSDITDIDGNILVVVKLGKINIQAILDRSRNSDYILCNILFAEMARQQLHAIENTTKKPTGCTVIYDLQDIQLGKALLEALQGGPGTVIRLIQAHFPELTKRLIIVNVPPAIDYIWSAVKVFLAERTRKKVIFLGSDWRQTIMEYFDSGHLPEIFGGSSGIQYPDPVEIPVDARIYSLDDAPSLKLGYIKPKDSLVLETSIINPGLKLKWFFKANGELIFSVEQKFSTCWKLVLPKLPLNSVYHPEFGQVDCEPGTSYRVTFQNCASYLFSTKLEYAVQIIQKDGTAADL